MTAASSGTSHPIFARVYPWLARQMEKHGVAEHRGRLLAAATGRVVEVGAGHGVNFRYYPEAVSDVVAIEPERHLRELAERAARRASVDITVHPGDAARLPLADASCDAAVTSLVLCSVPDQDAALSELHRVLVPGGRLHFFEHVAACRGPFRRVQRMLDATVWPTLAAGCHAARDTLAAIDESGFTIEDVEHLAIPDGRIALPTSPHILGTAVRRER